MTPSLSAEPIKLVTVPCDQCGSTDSTPVGAGQDREFESCPEVFTIVQCSACGLRFLNPRPDISELARIYPSTYQCYNVRPASAGDDKRSMVTKLRHRLYAKRFEKPLSSVTTAGDIAVLDVGCGDGWQLDLYRALAPDRIQTFGVEINEAVCDKARLSGHTITCGRFEDVHFDRRFDLVNLSQVIEHVAQPREFMAKIGSLLKPGGVLFLETPNTETVEWRWLKRGAWGAYHIPRHWTFFTPDSLQRMGESAGLTLLDLGFSVAPVHWVWTLHNLSLEQPWPLRPIGTRLFAPLSVFSGGVHTFALLGAFTALDMALRAVTGRTSNMMAIFQKPAA